MSCIGAISCDGQRGKKERNEQMNYQFPCSFSQVGKTQSLLKKKEVFF